MAKIENPSKSDFVRGFLKQNKAATVSEIVEGLRKEGITVSPALAGKIKYDRSRPKKIGNKPSPKAITKVTSVGLDIEALIATKRLAEEIGGLDKLRSSLDALESLKEAGVA